MSMIFPNSNQLLSQNNFFGNIPYPNIFYQMQDLTSTYIKCRIIQKNLVYLIGLSSDLVKKEPQLKSFEYFGQYGKIIKLVVNKNKIYNSNGPNGPSYTCFVTYSNEAESSLAILALDNTIIDFHEMKANYGTTKYCLNFLKRMICNNKDCIYLHKFANEKDIVSKEIMNSDKDIFPQQRLMAIELSKILTKEKYNELSKIKHIKTVFPNAFSVYKKDLVIKYIKERNLGIALNLTNTEIPKDKNKENNNNTKNKFIANNCKELINHFIEVKNNLHQLYKSTPKSRFNFVKEDQNLSGNTFGQIIPNKINDFLTQQFVRHSWIYKEEQKDISNSFFTKKFTSLDSDNSWSSLVTLIEKYYNKEETEEDIATKFHTY